MDLEYLLGQMVENMKDIILMIKSKGKEYLFGLMVKNMKDNG